MKKIILPLLIGLSITISAQPSTKGLENLMDELMNETFGSGRYSYVKGSVEFTRIEEKPYGYITYEVWGNFRYEGWLFNPSARIGLKLHSYQISDSYSSNNGKYRIEIVHVHFIYYDKVRSNAGENGFVDSFWNVFKKDNKFIVP